MKTTKKSITIQEHEPLIFYALGDIHEGSASVDYPSLKQAVEIIKTDIDNGKNIFEIKMKYILLIFFVLILACDGLNDNINLNPKSHKAKQLTGYTFIMVIDQASNIPWIFWRSGLRLGRVGVNAFELIYYNWKFTIACDKAMYMMSTGYRLLVTKEDYTRMLEWIMPGTKIKFEKIKKNKGGKSVENN
jgi:hypothetical protein